MIPPEPPPSLTDLVLNFDDLFLPSNSRARHLVLSIKEEWKYVSEDEQEECLPPKWFNDFLYEGTDFPDPIMIDMGYDLERWISLWSSIINELPEELAVFRLPLYFGCLSIILEGFNSTDRQLERSVDALNAHLEKSKSSFKNPSKKITLPKSKRGRGRPMNGTEISVIRFVMSSLGDRSNAREIGYRIVTAAFPNEMKDMSFDAFRKRLTRPPFTD